MRNTRHRAIDDVIRIAEQAFGPVRREKALRDFRQDLNIGERERASTVGMPSAIVVFQSLPDDDEKALAEHGDAMVRLRMRLELALGHFDERCRMAELLEESAVHDAHVLVAAKRRNVPPLFERNRLGGRGRPGAFRIKQGAKRG